MLDLNASATIIDACAAGIVLIGIVLATARSIGRSIWLVALHGALGGVAAIAVGLSVGAAHVVAGGVLAMIVKGVILPLVLGSVLRHSTVRSERHLLLDRRLLLLAAVGIVFAANAAADGGPSGIPLASAAALPAAIASVLTGLLIVMTRRKALSLIVGLLVFENGIALAAFAMTYGMPLVIELGVLFDLLIAMVVVWVYARSMLALFGSTSTDRLRNLRG